MTNTSSSSQPQWQLVLFEGPGAPETFPITGEILTLGRALNNDISMDNLHLSKHHARLVQQENQLIIEDLESVNGTVVNGEPIAGPQTLRPNDTITVGPFSFRVEEPILPVPPSRVETRAYPVPPSKRNRERAWIFGSAILVLILLIVIALLAGYWLSSPESGPAVVDTSPTATVTLDVPRIEIEQAPPDNSRLSIREPVTIQAVASDPAGITRLELWANRLKVDQVESTLTTSPASMTTAFEWVPDSPGTYTLEVRAYNEPGLASIQEVATVTVIGEPDTPTPVATDTPTPTITPLPPSPTPIPTDTPTVTPTPTPAATPTPSVPSLTIETTTLNVRSGPGTQYGIVGQLRQGDQAEIVGQADLGQGSWWQIRFGDGPGDLGWILANPNLSTTSNATDIPLISPPPLPASTATPAPSPTPTVPTTVIRAPEGKTLLIVSNRSFENFPARLTLSGGKSVGGGREIDVGPGEEVRVVLEPDDYRALWSTPARDFFVRGADFTAVAGKVMVMWIVPEDGLTSTELYDQITTTSAQAPPPG